MKTINKNVGGDSIGSIYIRTGANHRDNARLFQLAGFGEEDVRKEGEHAIGHHPVGVVLLNGKAKLEPNGVDGDHLDEAD